jgi:NADH-quinone oxidoreductase subunit G
MSANQTENQAAEVPMVTITLDDNQVRVPAGINLIEAARIAEQEIPHYCYHSELSVPGNCRMCQVEVEGAPKLMIGCATPVRDGMVIRTHLTSQKVKDTQAETLELILINHPLDCTVCDQAGHCKLQDYHFDYNAKPSRFLEEKEHKVKAVPLGPTVMLDGERCIMCTRCIRFCDEITETSELGMLNRGDQSVIAIDPTRPLDNALSGSVVDLCPVGALTHSEWRFNTRIWYTEQKNSICHGCSTGCNVKVATRDQEIVQVKARRNDAVNKEWLCDEGRYGFKRFAPENRLLSSKVKGESVATSKALAELKGAAGKEPLVFLSPDLLLEDMLAVKQYLDAVVKKYSVVVAYRQRELSKVEKVLVSPDYSANFRAAQVLGLVPNGLSDAELENEYVKALGKLRVGAVKSVLVVGDRGILPADRDEALIAGFGKIEFSAAFLTNADNEVANSAEVVVPIRTVLETSGTMVNRSMRLQYSDSLLAFPEGAGVVDGIEPTWRLFEALQKPTATKVALGDDRQMTIRSLTHVSALLAEKGEKELTIKQIKREGASLGSLFS